MKLIALGDIHGRDTWKQVINYEKTFDKVVFIGDYFDSFDLDGNTQLENFFDICQFKRDNMDTVILLIGNHDFHYWPGITENYSGYQPHMRASFEFALNENKDILQMCYIDDYGTVYSHAGFTETFLEKKIISTFSEQTVNDMWKYKPTVFSFYQGDRSDCGDNINQGCLWVRPQSLWRDSISPLQVVGHTPIHQIDHPAKSERRRFYLIDALWAKSKQYLICVDGKFKIKSLSNEEK